MPAKKKKIIKKAKTTAKPKVKKVAKTKKEKLLGSIEHFFDKISVAAIVVKSPFKVGDFIHIKGHTTDFVQKVDSMQLDHENIPKAKKGDDVGIRVKEKVRGNDSVFLSDQKELGIKPFTPMSMQKAVTQTPAVQKPITQSFGARPMITKPSPAPFISKEQPKKRPGAEPYSGTSFLKF